MSYTATHSTANNTQRNRSHAVSHIEQDQSKGNFFGEENSQFDEDGNPKTVSAAMKKFHSNN